ncbi:CvpA family protein [Flavisolibacter ginsengisoli]|jgi:membrane protein required for colicin V production|uniref:Membrane protein required for colicin V production n=1 Tax=Flavisolibacter ginsengisoli DSM 18119 TaxID=1121884 RepID=A0A1M5EDA7_9BACT|nr:CvpA family protein [Flavisolibacter ginsengisoli]SHF77061.1 membrane protein required for colicin V production [Flavisolibacter ginsengisoli DSM 18119]
MFIDTVALVLLIISVFKGFTKGFIVALFSFLAFIIGLAAALKLSTLAASYIGNAVNISQRWLPVLAFFVVFLIVALAIRLGAKMLEGVVKLAMLGWLNRLGGIIFYILIYFFIFSILLFYAQQLHFLKPETIEASVSYPWIQPIAPKIMSIMGAVMPFFKDMFDQLLQFFQNVSGKKA